MDIQTRADKQDFGQCTQFLVRLFDEVRRLGKPFPSDKPMIKGSLYELKRKCGKPGCKSAQGQLHCRMGVSASEKGKTRLYVIPWGFPVQVQGKVRRYQELRRARTRLVEVHRKKRLKPWMRWR